MNGRKSWESCEKNEGERVCCTRLALPLFTVPQETLVLKADMWEGDVPEMS